MKKTNQRGLTSLESVLIVVCVAAIGAAGYFAYHDRQHKPEYSADNSKKTSTPTNNTKALDEAANWYSYKSPGGEFSIKLPDGWKLTRYLKSANIYANSNNDIVYSKGTSAGVAEVEGGRDFGAISYILYYSKTADARAPVGVKQGTFNTNDGVVVEKYYNLVGADPEGPGAPKGTKQHIYVAKKGDYSIFIEHDTVAGEDDQTGYIEKSIRTLTF